MEIYSCAHTESFTNMAENHFSLYVFIGKEPSQRFFINKYKYFKQTSQNRVPPFMGHIFYVILPFSLLIPVKSQEELQPLNQISVLSHLYRMKYVWYRD